MNNLLANIVVLAALAGAASAQPVPEAVDKVLAANHAAVGDVPSSGSADLTYDYASSGLTGWRKDISDLASGAYVFDEEAGGIADARGYDGKTPWMRDVSGANTTQEGGDRVAVAVNEAYRLANRWWQPGYGGAHIAYVAREILDSRALDHITVTPQGGKQFGAWFDAETHLLDRIAEQRQFFHTRTLYADYRREGGLMLAHTVTVDNGAGDDSYDHLKLTQVTLGGPRPLAAYARPTAPPRGAAIDGGAASTTLPFRLLNNHIYVDARVNGRGPYTFIVDTGGHTLVSPRLVEALGLKSIGVSASAGAGEGASTTSFAHVDEIAIGAVRLRDQVAFATEVYDKSIEGLPVDGMVGFELFRRMAVRIDYSRRTLTFTDPAHFDPRGAGVAVPFVFYDHMPTVQGLIDELPARFEIDTGSRSEVDVTGPFVASRNLRTRFPKGVSAVTGWGTGGPSRAYTVRLPSLTLGGVQVDGPTAGLSEDKAGSFSDPNFEGNIGGGFLKRFVVTFDYAHQTLYLKRISPEPIDAGCFDRAGMWINAGQDGFTITDVSVNGPAAKAGLLVGDVIVSLDGAPARPEGLSDARIVLRARPSGTAVQVVVRRGQDRHILTLVLRDQI
jgi:predicted aspartyl protease